MAKKSLGNGLREVSSIFLSNNVEEGQKKTVEGFSSESAESNTQGSHTAEDERGVEESVSVHKRVAYVNTEDGQRGMRRDLFKYLEDGYQIRSMTLRKTDRGRGSGGTEKREEVTIFVKGP